MGVGENSRSFFDRAALTGVVSNCRANAAERAASVACALRAGLRVASAGPAGPGGYVPLRRGAPRTPRPSMLLISIRRTFDVPRNRRVCVRSSRWPVVAAGWERADPRLDDRRRHDPPRRATRARIVA